MTASEQSSGSDSGAASGGGTGSRDGNGFASSLPIPQSKAFYLVVALGLVMIAVGRFAAYGEPAGLYGIWGISLIAAAVLVFLSNLLWHYWD